MRRRAWPPAFLAISAALAGCTPYLTASDTEQSMAASCRAWEERAAKAAHPDAEAIARHDRLMAKAAQFKAEALANYKNVSVRQAAIENEAQSEIDAAAVYDWRADLKIASSCWEGLALTQEIHREQRERLSRMAEEFAASARSSASFAPSASAYTLHTQPPAAPQPSPIPNLQSTYGYEHPPVKTWGQTPCAPAIPPAMRDLPVTSTDPKIPEGCL